MIRSHEISFDWPLGNDSARFAKECHRLALKTGDQGLIAEAKASFAMVAGLT